MTIAKVLGRPLNEVKKYPADEIALWLAYFKYEKELAAKEQKQKQRIKPVRRK